MALTRIALTIAIALATQSIRAVAQEPLGILLAAGDIAKCGPQNKKDESVAAVLAREVKAADVKKVPVHVLVLGDLAYDHGTPEDFKCFEESWGSLLKLKLANSDPMRLMLPVPGNHEYEQAGAMPYYNYFERAKNPWIFQQEKDQKKQQANNKGYYALKFPDPANGPWHLFGLNSELRGSSMKAQLDWLEAELKATDPVANPKRAPCVLAFWHRPLFSSGTHGHGDCYGVEGKPCERTDAPLCRPDQEAPYCASIKKMKPAYQLLYNESASVILSGHDHHFEQFKRLNVDAKPDATRGVRSFIVGTGGGSLYQKKRTYRWGDDVRDVYSHSSFGALRIDVFSDRYAWRFLPIDGNPEVPLQVGSTTIDRDVCVARP
jgi:hypothetical protein